MRKVNKFLTGRGAIFNSVPTNSKEALQHGNALAYGKDSNYPVGTSECFNVEISGGCGCSCFVIGKNECKEPAELYGQIRKGERDSELKHYKEDENKELDNAVKNRIKEKIRSKGL